MIILHHDNERRRRLAKVPLLTAVSLFLVLLIADGLYAQIPRSIMLQRDIQKLQDRPPTPRYEPAEEKTEPAPRPIRRRISHEAVRNDLELAKAQRRESEADRDLTHWEIQQLEVRKQSLETDARIGKTDKATADKGIKAFDRAITARKRQIRILEKKIAALTKKISALKKQMTLLKRR